MFSGLTASVRTDRFVGVGRAQRWSRRLACLRSQVQPPILPRTKTKKQIIHEGEGCVWSLKETVAGWQPLSRLCPAKELCGLRARPGHGGISQERPGTGRPASTCCPLPLAEEGPGPRPLRLMERRRLPPLPLASPTRGGEPLRIHLPLNPQPLRESRVKGNF